MSVAVLPDGFGHQFSPVLYKLPLSLDKILRCYYSVPLTFPYLQLAAPIDDFPLIIHTLLIDGAHFAVISSFLKSCLLLLPAWS